MQLELAAEIGTFTWGNRWGAPGTGCENQIYGTATKPSKCNVLLKLRQARFSGMIGDWELQHKTFTMRLLEALHLHARTVTLGVENSRLFTHMGDRGTFRERVIREFLRPFLPPAYGLSAGEVFAADGSQSAQVDIVVYDALFSTVLFRDASQQLFPAESVFGTIEVKSRLCLEELDRACNNVASVKRLPRTSTDMMDLLPTVRFAPDERTFSWSRVPLNPYAGFVFGYGGAAPESVATELNRRLEAAPADKQMLPDLVFVADPGYMVFRVSQTGAILRPGRDFVRFGFLRTGDDTVPLFFLTLNTVLAELRLRGIDYMQLWRQLIDEVIARNRGAPPS
jgi:hypothetical protein